MLVYGRAAKTKNTFFLIKAQNIGLIFKSKKKARTTNFY